MEILSTQRELILFGPKLILLCQVAIKGFEVYRNAAWKSSKTASNADTTFYLENNKESYRIRIA